MREPDLVVLALPLGAHGVEGAVVEDVAVLVDLDERRALVSGGGAQRLRHVRLVRVDRARHERRLRPERQRDRVEGMVLRAERRRLGDLALLARGRVLALRQAVDLVVEEQDLERHVAPERVDEVVAADRERVAVTRDHPDGQVGTRGRHARGERGSTAVDAVHPVGVHVVDEAPGAADARHEHDLVRRDAELRHERLDGGEDRVVAAAGAPARLLVGREVRLRQLEDVPAVARAVRPAHASLASICSIMSRVKIGRPSTFVKLSQGIRNSARRTFTSWPMFISGTSTRS